jgi:hypothetical protein
LTQFKLVRKAWLWVLCLGHEFFIKWVSQLLKLWNLYCLPFFLEIFLKHVD